MSRAKDNPSDAKGSAQTRNGLAPLRALVRLLARQAAAEHTAIAPALPDPADTSGARDAKASK